MIENRDLTKSYGRTAARTARRSSASSPRAELTKTRIR
ncbi:hypothetical protein FHR93_002990 [Geodermatophilus sabuli]|uniref:Uncharacterized protein n=1 Tax=Geodermatophilus sabuli TaxID=1564158 RepID=A0A285E9L4_9ACTN|nr:hypothetical protein [Geodermatophilus sabuli]SNX95819.1 hypothetical protein SAMN06893097_102523 [Geodermatophilus sabuli]